MIDVLDKALAIMNELVDVPLSKWDTERIDSLPTLDRLKRTVVIDGEQFDLFLHKGYWPLKDEVAQPHTHACDSAMYIVRGKYELTFGYGENEKKYERIARLIMNRGDKYEMTSPYVWHYFKPLSDYTLTIMIAGRVYNKRQPGVPGQLSVDLPEKDAQDLLDTFQQIYCGEFFCA